jgi:hypothetical protein
MRASLARLSTCPTISAGTHAVTVLLPLFWKFLIEKLELDFVFGLHDPIIQRQDLPSPSKQYDPSCCNELHYFENSGMQRDACIVPEVVSSSWYECPSNITVPP